MRAEGRATDDLTPLDAVTDEMTASAEQINVRDPNFIAFWRSLFWRSTVEYAGRDREGPTKLIVATDSTNRSEYEELARRVERIEGKPEPVTYALKLVGMTDLSGAVEVPLHLLDLVKELFAREGIRYWVSHDRTSINGRPPVTWVNLRWGSDPAKAQALLDTVR